MLQLYKTVNGSTEIVSFVHKSIYLRTKAGDSLCAHNIRNATSYTFIYNSCAAIVFFIIAFLVHFA